MPRLSLRFKLLLGPGLLLAALAMSSVTRADDSPGSSGAQPAAFTPEALDFFETRVRPILAENCQKCHGPEEQKSGLRLDSRAAVLAGGNFGPAVVPGDPEASVLIEAVRQEDEFLKMPPKSKLPDEAVATLTDWVKMGAPWPSGEPIPAETQESESQTHWAFQPVRNVEPPKVRDTSWVATPVDAFVLAKLEAKGLSPSPPADRRTLLRRLSFDLTGLPPTVEEIDAFESDTAPNAYEKAVDRLLASPRYGERWGRHWLDVARYADTKGYVFTAERRYPYAYTYRDWVINAFNDDLPYDQFVLQQLAADKLPLGEDTRPLAAMGFLTVGRRFLNVQEDIIDDRIDVVSRGFLGLTVACARCHDHKFDPIPTEDYYSLYGVFASSDEPDNLPVIQTAGTDPQYEDYKAQCAQRDKAIADFIAQTKSAIEADFREHVGEFLAAAAELNFQPREGDLDKVARSHKLDPSRVHVFVFRLAQRLRETKDSRDPIFAPWQALAALPDDQRAAKAAETIEPLKNPEGDKPPANPLVLEALAAPEPPLASMQELARRYGEVFAAALADGSEPADPGARDAIRAVLTGENGLLKLPEERMGRGGFNRAERDRLSALRRERDALDVTHPGAPPRAMVMNDRPKPVEPHVFMRGNPGRPGKQVPRRFLKLLSEKKERTPFPADSSGRLELARAIVDPSNPLTPRVMVNRIWMHHFGTGLVRTASDFGLRSDPPTHPDLLDWLARQFIDGGWSIKKIHRLIVLSNAYQQQSFARSECLAADPENQLLWRQNRQRLDFEAMRDTLLAVAGQLDEHLGGRSVSLVDPPFTNRRAVYGFIDRQNLEGLFRTFDFATPTASSPGRFTTIVPQQALFLMNNPFVTQQSQRLASLAATASNEPEGRVEDLYRRVLGRAPSEQERSQGAAFLRETENETKAPPWQYGYGAIDEASGKVAEFQPLPHFAGKAWQLGAEWPHDKGNFLRLTSEGGHVGPDQSHAAIRRWVAPHDGAIAIEGRLGHESDKGDGVRGRIVSGQGGVLGTWTAHHSKAETPVERYGVHQGETIDFVVDCQAEHSFDSFTWNATIRLLDPSDAAGQTAWNARDDFQGPMSEPLSALELYAQVLLMTNEFMYVD